MKEKQSDASHFRLNLFSLYLNIYMTVKLGDYRDHITDEHHIQAIITDPPYNSTGLDWDGSFDPKQFWAIITPQLAEQCVVILTAQMRLAVDLISTATIPFRHDLVWEKPNGTGQVRYQPNRCHELVLVFGRGTPVYNPQLVAGKPYTWQSTRSKGGASGYSGAGSIHNTGTRHPRSVLRMQQQRGLHPTQKPVDLWRFLINSYTEPTWRIYDPFAGAGVTAVACEQLQRPYWCCELMPEHHATMLQRIQDLK